MDEQEHNDLTISNPNGQDVPSGWARSALIRIVRFSRKPRDLKIPSGGIPFIPMELIPAGGSIRPGWEIRTEGEINSGSYCEKGDILLPKITPSFENGKQAMVVGIPGEFAYATTEVFSFSPKSRDVDDEFLFFYFLAPTVRAELAGKMEGSTGRQRIPKAVVENLDVLLPPLPEQRAIAHVLSTVQQVIKATDVVIAATSELKRSLLEYLFTYGPVPVNDAGQADLKVTEIGSIPGHWSVTAVDEIAEVNPETRNPSEQAPHDLFTYVDISAVESETGRFLTPTSIMGKDAPSRARRVIRKDDVILSTVRPYLKSFAIVPMKFENAICSTGFAVLRAKDPVVSRFLLYTSFSRYVGEQFKKRMKGASYPAINTSDVKETLFPVPPKGEQNQITEVLCALDRKLNIEITRKEALEAIFSTLLSRLMIGTLRVQIKENRRTEQENVF